MPTFGKPYIGQATYLLNFKSLVDKIRFEQAGAENAFGSMVNVQSQQTNVPDEADANIARIVFPSEKKSISISQAGCQLDLAFSDGEKPFDQQVDIIAKNVADFHSRAFKFRQPAEYGLNALILNINFPSPDSSEDLNKAVYERFVKVPPIGEVASVQQMLGFKIGDHFINLGVNVYETRRAEVPRAPLGRSVSLEISEMKLIEQGMCFRLDVNNRPQITANAQTWPSDSDEVVSAAKNFLQQNFADLSGLTLN